MRTPTVVAAAVASLVVGIVAAVGLEAAARHSGRVSAVDQATRIVVVDELVEEGKLRKLQVEVAPNARVMLSERTLDPQSPDREGPFVDKPLQFADLRPGDFVIVEGTARGNRLVADVVIVTLRAAPR